MKFKRPRCENCGAKIYPITKRYKIPDFLHGRIPSHCQNCGKEISNEKNAQVVKYNIFGFCLWCIGSILFIIVLSFILISIS